MVSHWKSQGEGVPVGEPFKKHLELIVPVHMFLLTPDCFW
ncbi:Uncharacterised protein [Chlamydia trachomatis]|nr:Uncharacterised protein [Chlamydia trachomatis]